MKLIWLKCASSNHDPAVIAGYCVNAIHRLGCLPNKFRTDCRTENVNFATLTFFFPEEMTATFTEYGAMVDTSV
jgi:hypothetical protein